VGRPVGALAVAISGFVAYGLAVDSPFVWIYVPITIVLAVAVFFIHRSVELSMSSLWWLVAAAIGNLAGGIYLIDGQPLYVKRLVGDIRYDKPFHTVATAIGAWAAYEVVAKWAVGRASRPAIAVAAVLVAAGLGALVEIVEFVGSIVIENANVGGYGDTMLDLVVNTAGGAAAVIIQDHRRPGPGAGLRRRWSVPQ
jgi:hypothetical protein